MTSRHAEVITSVFQVPRLREGEGANDTVTNNGAVKKPRNMTEDFNANTKIGCSFKSDNKGTITINEEGVVNINSEDAEEVGNGNSEDGGIDKGLIKAEGDKPGCKKRVPSARGFTNAVHGLVELAYETSARRGRNMITLMLLHADARGHVND